LIVKITGTNDDPILDSITQVNTTEDRAIVNGTITSTDVDDNAIATYSTSSTVGGFTLNPDGTYSFDPSHADHQHIEEGEVKTITIPVTVTDDKGATDTENLIIKITGTNDDPVLDSITQVNTTEDDAVINGTITSTDVDDNATATYSTNSTVGGFTLNPDGTYSFDPSHADHQHIEEGEIKTITIPVTVTDDKGATDTENLIIKLTGTNDDPVLDSITQVNTTEDGAIVNGTITSTDVDDNATATYSTTSTVGGFTLNPDGTYSFDPSHADHQHIEEGEIKTITIPVTVTDDKGATDTESLVIKITGTNDDPILDSITQVNTTEDGAIVNGTITSTDVDDNATATYSTSSTVGGFTLNPDGTYSFDPSHADHQHIEEGEVKTITIPITVTDDKGATDTENLIVKLTGTNDDPILDSITQVNTTEDGAIVNGTITSTDVDDNATATYSTSSTVGGFTLNPDGTYSFDPSHADHQHIEEGEIKTITIPVTVTDDKGGTDTENLIIKLTGTNDDPVSDSITQVNTTEDGAVINGTITSTDVDDNATATYSTNSTVGGFTLNPDGTYSFDPSHADHQHIEEGEVKTITIPVTVTDDKGGTDTENLVIKLTGTNDDPILDSITQVNTTEDGAIVNGTITSTDVDDNATATYSTTSTVGGFTLNPDGTYSFDPSHADHQHIEEGEVKTITIPVTVTDDKGATDTENLIIKITGTNDDPVLDSITQVNTTEDGAIVNGTITSTDVDDNATATYSTSSTVGGFTLNPDGTYSFDPSHADHQHIEEGEIKTITIPVTVTDDKGATDTENLIIKLTGTNDDPVLDSITQVNTTEDDAVINGTITSTDVDDNATATYSTTATVDGFTLNPDGTYSFDPADSAYQRLEEGVTQTITIPITVTDDKGAIDTENLVITVTGTNDESVIVADVNTLTELVDDTTTVNAVTGNVLDNDSDVDRGTTFEVTGVSTHEEKMSFNGSDGFISVDTHNNFQYGTDSFTWSMTVTPDDTDKVNWLMRTIGSDSSDSDNPGGHTDTQDAISMYINSNGQVYVSMRDENGNSLGSGFRSGVDHALTAGQEYQIALVVNRDTNQASIVIDGVVVDTEDISSLGAINSDNDLYIGTDDERRVGYMLDGEVSDIQIYNTQALTAEELNTIRDGTTLATEPDCT
jgi:VCBS repeat-containing protein